MVHREVNLNENHKLSFLFTKCLVFMADHLGVHVVVSLSLQSDTVGDAQLHRKCHLISVSFEHFS